MVDKVPQAGTEAGVKADATQLETDGSVKEVVVEPTPSPWWSENGKYKTEQAYQDSKKASEREMHLAQQELALTRKEMDLLKQSKATPQTVAKVMEEVPEHVKQQIEAKYDMDTNYGRVAAMNDLMDIKFAALNENIGKMVQQAISPIEESFYTGKADSILKKLNENDPVVQEFPVEFEARFKRLSSKDRTNPDKINEIRNELLSGNLDKIVARAKEEGVKSVRGKAATPPNIQSGSDGPTIESKTEVLTEQQKAQILKFGGDIAETEAFLTGKNKPKTTNWI